jgi:hypothetical protein
MYKDIFAFGGADQRILTRLYNSDYSDRLIVENSHNCPPMCRIDPNGFNFLVTNTEELSKYAVAQGVKDERENLNGMRFDPNKANGGQTGVQAFIHYSISAYNRWDYDQASGRYLRFVDTQEITTGGEEAYAPFMDRLANQQVAADNVVILYAPHQFAYKKGNSEIVDIQLNGSGQAYAFRDGQIYQVKWNRPSPDSVLYLTFSDGSLYPYKPGTTWYQVIGQTSKMEPQGKGAFRFTFGFP